MKTLREYIDLIKEVDQDTWVREDQAKKYLEQKQKITKQLMAAIGPGATRVEREYAGAKQDEGVDYQVEYSPQDADGHYIFWIWGPQETDGGNDQIGIAGHFRSNTSDEDQMKDQLDNSWTITGPYKQPLSDIVAHYKKIKPTIDKWIANNQSA